MATRKAIAAALLEQLVAGGQFVKQGRRLRAPVQAATPQKPALYLIKPRERYAYDNADEQGVPPVRSFLYYAVIYTDVGLDESQVPADVIDDLLDAIDAALEPSVTDQLANGGRQTLGSLVHAVRIDGEVAIAAGDKQGKGTTMVPIRVWLNSYP